MAVNYGKKFEHTIKESLLKISDIDVNRIPDQQSGFYGSKNISDFEVYKYPYHYYFECKVVAKGNILSFSRISNAQWQGLLQKSKIKGVIAGILCWWVEKETTLFLPIKFLRELKNIGQKSVRYDTLLSPVYFDNIPMKIKGRKKRVFYDYDFSDFFLTNENYYDSLLINGDK